MMYRIKKETQIEIIEKKSKFITRINNIKSEEEAKNQIEEISKAEKGAVHNCYAYRILSQNNSIIEKKNDDGEPGGTAGAPMLAVLTGEGIINALAVTTRYFGGIKLGTGGLVNVYARGVKEVLKASGKIEHVITESWKIEFAINKTDLVQYQLNKEDFTISEREFKGNNVSFIVDVPENSINNIRDIAKLVQGNIIKL